MPLPGSLLLVLSLQISLIIFSFQVNGYYFINVKQNQQPVCYNYLFLLSSLFMISFLSCYRINFPSILFSPCPTLANSHLLWVTE